MDHLSIRQTVQCPEEFRGQEGGLRSFDPDGMGSRLPRSGFDEEGGDPTLDRFDQETVGSRNSVVADGVAADRESAEFRNA
jgi:hypothetical protein